MTHPMPTYILAAPITPDQSCAYWVLPEEVWEDERGVLREYRLTDSLPETVYGPSDMEAAISKGIRIGVGLTVLSPAILAVLCFGVWIVA